MMKATEIGLKTINNLMCAMYHSIIIIIIIQTNQFDNIFWRSNNERNSEREKE